MSLFPLHDRLSPEGRLLLLTAGGPELDPHIRRALDGPINWWKLSAMAEGERASAVAWRRIAAVGVDRIPAAVREHMARLAMVAEFRALYLEQRLDETLQAFAREGIDVVLLKGAALAKTVYGGFTERPMGDLDLLIDDTRAADARRVALEAGWMADEKTFPAAAYAGHHHAPPLSDAKGTGVRLELHRALFIEGHLFALTREELLRDAARVPIEGATAYVPSTAHLLVHLCVHFAWSHMMQFGTWRMVRDLDALTRSGRVVWEEISATARVHRAATCVYWTLRLGSRVAQVPVPGEVFDALRPVQSEGVLSGLERHLSVQLLPWDSCCPSERVRRMMWSLAVLPKRSGHGPARPWDHDEVGTVTAGAQPASVWRRLRRHAATLEVWGRYLRLLVDV